MSDDDPRETFAAEIERKAGEPIEAIVIGEQSYRPKGNVSEDVLNTVLTWEEARPLLDYEYNRGYGLSEAHPVVVWTEHGVMFSVVYDGKEWLAVVPRNPMPWLPSHHGGE